MLKDIIAFLKPTSFFARETARQSLFISAFLDHPELIDKIDYAGSAAEFVPRMVHILIQHGEITSGTQALWQLLLTMRSEIGLEGQQQVDAFENWANTSHKISLSSNSTLSDILEFEKTYREMVAQRHRFITPPSAQGERPRVPINDLYVAPSLVSLSESQSKPLAFKDAIKAIRRTVILANPGGGKSTLALKLCADLSNQYGKTLWNGQAVSPVLVVLHEYGLERATRQCSIAEFIELKSSSNYQIKAPVGAFDYLLSQGRLLVIFDGLDELIDPTDRQTIADDLEAFCYRYASTPVLITSREVGYQEAPLDSAVFQLYQIIDFDEKQIQEYVHKWFAFEESFSRTTPNTLTAFFEELADVPAELKSNPLMLALICTIYKGEGYIPRNRPEIYEKCTELLFRKRDQERRIYDMSLERHLSNTVFYLAHWIYGDPALEEGVSERKLIAQVTNYLEGQTGNRDQSERDAQKIVTFFTGRAWVFTDTGLKNGERLYQFTHRTFLEYLTCRYLLQKRRYPTELLEFLEPKIALGQWMVVAELAFQRMDQDAGGVSDELLQPLIIRAKLAPENEAFNLLRFTVRCMTFLSPRETTMRDILQACLDLGIKLGVKDIRYRGLKEIYSEQPLYENSDFLKFTLRDLFLPSQENSLTLARLIEPQLIAMIKANSDIPALIAAEIGMNLPFLISNRDRIMARFNEIENTLRKSSEKITEETSKHLIAHLSPKYERVALDLYNWGKIGLEQLVTWHGTQILFKEHNYLIFSHRYDGQLVGDLLRDSKSDMANEQHHYWIEQLTQLGRILLHTKPPWVTLGHMNSSGSIGTYPKNARLPQGDALFGLFTALAFGHEFNMNYHLEEPTWEDIVNAYPEPLRWPFIMRSRQAEGRRYINDEDTFQEEFDRNELTDKQRAFIERWSFGGNSLIEFNY